MTTVQNHIVEKFAKFAASRNITILKTPTMCDIVIFDSANKGKTQHMAAPARKNNVPGFLINLGDKKLKFFPATDVHCKALQNGSLVKNKARLCNSKEGITFGAV